MEEWRISGVVAFWCVIFLPLLGAGSVSGLRILVGGKKGWSPNVNYTEWSAERHFYVGNWLYFVYDKNYYSVLEVNKTDYERCSTDHPIGNYTGGAGRDVVQLNESRPYYFVSGGWSCWSNMKLFVFVEQNPPEPAPAPTKNASSPPSRSLYWILACVVAAWASLAFIF